MLEVCLAATWKVLETTCHWGRVFKRKTPSENPNRSTNLGYYFLFGIGLGKVAFRRSRRLCFSCSNRK